MSQNVERIELSRDCEAVEIPAGRSTTLKKGVEAYITQSLGGTYTLQVPSHGGLFRIASKDADAIGKQAVATAAAGETGGNLENQVWEQLKTCYDPEIPVNIVDLGLVYDMQITAETEGKSRVDVKMTLTAQGCGMGVSIAGDAQQKLLGLPGVSDANVEIVWEPPWNPQMISPEGKERLGID